MTNDVFEVFVSTTIDSLNKSLFQVSSVYPANYKFLTFDTIFEWIVSNCEFVKNYVYDPHGSVWDINFRINNFIECLFILEAISYYHNCGEFLEDNFTDMVFSRLGSISRVLSHKGTEYQSDKNSNRFQNFIDLSDFEDVPSPEILWGMARKHLWSVIEIVKFKKKFKKEFISEKFGDLINYLILLNAMLFEQNERC